MSSPRRQHQRESLRQLRERMAQIDRRLAAMRSAEGDAAATRGEMSVPPPFAPLQHETRPGAGPSQNHEPIVLCRNYPVAGDTLTVMKHRKSWSESVSAAGSSNAAADSQETPGTPLLFPKAVSDLGPDPLPRAASLGSVRRRIPYGPVCPETLNAVGVTRLLATKLRVPATVVPETQTDRHVDFPAPKSNADGRAIANDPATNASEQTLIAIANGGCDNVEAKLSGQYQPSPLPASEAPLYIEINGNGLKRGNSSCLCVMSNELKGRPERYLRRDAGAMGKAGGVRLFVGLFVITLVTLFLPCPARCLCSPARRPYSPARRLCRPRATCLQPARRPCSPRAARLRPGRRPCSPRAAHLRPARCPCILLVACLRPARQLTFDHEGRLILFDTWLDDLQLYLLSDSRDSVSLFDHMSGASLAPPATADSATHSQWLTR
ncbi:unnamed protein product [Closterium sp. NIES-53]